ncbi:hypothetical protein C8R43DRAFT_1041418 [Mycena crocata]|nr:hypothetical protein C8R43DRAFT_1041418 [Mycena crocata]
MLRTPLRIALSSNASAGVRNASSEAAVGVVPGIPSLPTRTPKTFMSFAMPDPPQQDRPQVQIPYLPDFWESASAQSPQPAETPVLKLSVVDSLNTHHNHNMHDEHASPDTLPVGPRPLNFGKGGILQDMSEDMGLPTKKQIQDGLSKILKSFS